MKTVCIATAIALLALLIEEIALDYRLTKLEQSIDPIARFIDAARD